MLIIYFAWHGNPYRFWFIFVFFNVCTRWQIYEILSFAKHIFSSFFKKNFFGGFRGMKTLIDFCSSDIKTTTFSFTIY